MKIKRETKELFLNQLSCQQMKIWWSYYDAYEVVDELFESLQSKYQRNLETSMRGSDFIFDSFQLMYYKCHKVNFSRNGSCIDSPD